MWQVKEFSGSTFEAVAHEAWVWSNIYSGYRVASIETLSAAAGAIKIRVWLTPN